MKKVFLLSVCFTFILAACNKNDEEFAKRQDYNETEKTDSVIRNQNRSVLSCDDLSISYAIIYQDANCCNYQFNLKTTAEDSEVPVSVKLNGIDYEEYNVKDAETFYLSLCPDPDVLVEIYVGEELCFSESLNCRCPLDCSAVNITSNLVQKEGDCCLYSINFAPVCPGKSVLLDYYIDQTIVQNLNITNNTSISVEVCNDEKKAIEVRSGRGLCFSEVLECIDCCSDLEYTIDGLHLGGGCCEFIFELLGPEDCIDSYITAFGWNPAVGLDGIEYYEFVGNTIRVGKCLPEQYVYFVVFDENMDTCFQSSNLQYCQD